MSRWAKDRSSSNSPIALRMGKDGARYRCTSGSLSAIFRFLKNRGRYRETIFLRQRTLSRSSSFVDHCIEHNFDNLETYQVLLKELTLYQP